MPRFRRVKIYQRKRRNCTKSEKIDPDLLAIDHPDDLSVEDIKKPADQSSFCDVRCQK